MSSKVSRGIIIILSVIAIAKTIELQKCSKKYQSKSIDKIVVAYIYADNRKVNPEIIEADKMTHINYAFANVRDDKVYLESKYDEKNMAILNSLKKNNPNLKILLSVGGWAWSGNFSDAALTKESRKKFVNSALTVVRENELDGIDLDWEYPGLPGKDNIHRPEDKQNFTILLKELRQAFDKYESKDDKNYLITIAAGASEKYINHTEMEKVAKYLDYVNLMTYDFYVAGADTISGHHACFETNPNATKETSTKQTVNMFVEAGVPAEKIVVGFPFYGRAWTDLPAKNRGLYQPGKAARIPTSYRSIKLQWENKNGFTRYWDKAAKAPYLWNDSSRTFITYEDDVSLKNKCEYINANNLKGIMFWEYHGDYQHELLNIMDNKLLNN